MRYASFSCLGPNVIWDFDPIWLPIHPFYIQLILFSRII